MISDLKCFTVTEDHIKLLRRMIVRQDKYNPPYIDPKRPYGNSDVFRDMREILGRPPGSQWDEMGDEPELESLHAETGTALEIMLRVGVLQPGDYFAPKYGSDWSTI